MAPTVFGGARNAAVLNGQFTWPMLNLSAFNTEADKAWPVRIAGTFSSLIGVYDANGTVRSTTFRKNSANSALKITPPDSTAGQFTDLVHSVHYAVGDTFDLVHVVTGTAFILAAFSGMFTADVGTVGFYASQLVTSGVSSSAFGTFGGISFVADTANNNILVRAPGTYSNLVIATQVNNATGNNVFNSRKNLANGNQTVTVVTLTTGVFEDTTNSDAVVSGDTFGWDGVYPAGGGGQTMQIGFTCSFTGAASEITGPGGNPNFTFNASNQFLSLLGATIVFTTEAGTSGPAIGLGCDGVLSNYRMGIKANTMTGTTTFVLRKNSTTVNSTFAIATVTTGTFEDTTHTDTFNAVVDKLNYMYTGGVSGNITAGYSAITMLPNNPTFPVDYSAITPRIPRAPDQAYYNRNVYSIVIAAAPFVPIDYPKSFFPRPLMPGQTALNLQLFTNPIPFGPFDWNKTTRLSPERSIPSRGLNINLFKNPIPFLNFVPTAVEAPIFLKPIIFYNAPLYAVTTSPFAQYNWRPPAQFPESSPSVQSYNQALYTVTVTTTEFRTPFIAMPYPVRPVRPDASRALNPNLFTNPIPFLNVGNARAVRVKSLLANDSPYNQSLYTVTVVSTTEFRTPLIMRPYPLRPALSDATLPSNPNLYGIVTVQVPFAQYDWSKAFVPRAASVQGQVPNPNLFTNPIPFAKFDWPRQVGVPQLPPNRSVQTNLNLFTNTIPFNQNQYPNPRPIKIGLFPLPPYNQNLYTVTPGPGQTLHIVKFIGNMGHFMIR